MIKRKPTDFEYKIYDGMHCRNLWNSLSDTWRCPVCGRSKREIMIWGVRTGSNARTYGVIGFKCGLHKHHDHSDINRFPVTVICGSCNMLDARLKKFLRTENNFSFSPCELKAILKYVEPNTGITKEQIDFDRAKEIYVECKTHTFRQILSS